MSRAAQEAYPEMNEELIFDFAEGVWPHDWDEAAKELIDELAGRN